MKNKDDAFETLVLIVCLLVLTMVIGCSIATLEKNVGKYGFLLDMSHVISSVLDSEQAIDYETLQGLSDTYGVDAVTPTQEFVQAAENLRQAYQQLYDAAMSERGIDPQLQTALSPLEGK
jgi:hypothetical protein